MTLLKDKRSQSLILNSAVLTMRLLLLCYRTLASALPMFGATPSCCRFLPTCSEYAQEAVRQHGWKGFLLTTRRLLRCRPLLASPVEQGVRFDPVPRTSATRSQFIPVERGKPCKAIRKTY